MRVRKAKKRTKLELNNLAWPDSTMNPKILKLFNDSKDPEDILNFKTFENILDFFLTCHLETSGIIFNPGGSAESDHSLRILPIEN